MSTIKISQLGNLTTVQGNVIVPVVGNVAGTWTTLQSNVAQLQTYILGTVVTDLANLTVATTANAAVQSGAIADVTTAWQANAITQLSQITGANAAIVTANTAMKGYVDAQDTTISNSVTGANAAIVTANTNMKGYVDGQITSVTNSVTGANAAIVTANTAMKGYVDAQDTTISNSVTGANAAIVTANTALKGYVDAQNTTISNSVTGANAAITTISNSVTGANAAIVTANTAMKGYVDSANTIQSNEITAVSNSVAGANAAIVTANTAMKGYVDANNATQLTSIENITNGSTGFGNIIPTADNTYMLGNLAFQWSSLYVDTVSATYINLPLNGIITGITFEGIDYSVVNGSNIGGAALTAGNNYVAVTQTQANVLIHNANTAVTHTWQFTEDGDINLPNGSILETNEDTPGMPSVSLSSGVNGGVGIAAISSNITAINGVFNQVTVNEYNAAIIIGDQIDGNVSYSWLFTTVANVGVISFPDSTNQQTAYTATLANVTPASATDTGTKGDIVYDASYIYICVETDQWIRTVRDAW